MLLINRLTLTASAAMLTLPVEAWGLEGGGAIYPPGIVTVMSGAVPAPGRTIVYSYNKLMKVDSMRGDSGERSVPSADGSIHAHALRVAHTFERASVMNGDFSLVAVLPYIYTDIAIASPQGQSLRVTSRGVADPLIGFMLSWTSPKYLQNIEVNYAAALGEYNRTAASNPGTNTRAIFVGYAFTWFPSPEYEISSKISVNHYWENEATSYSNGIQLVADFGMNYVFNENWRAGVGGFASTQLSDDEQSGRNIGNRTKSIKVGPQLAYANRRLGIVGSYQHDVFTRNTAGGNAFMVNFFIRM